jgi:hypothetical protein
MSRVKKAANDLESRIKDLEREIAMMESGVIATREKLIRDGKPLLIDNTPRSLARNRQWIMDLKALLARGALEHA